MTKTSQKKTANKGTYDRKARAALVALEDLIDSLPNSVKVGKVPGKIAAFKDAVANVKPKETNNATRKRSG